MATQLPEHFIKRLDNPASKELMKDTRFNEFYHIFTAACPGLIDEITRNPDITVRDTLYQLASVHHDTEHLINLVKRLEQLRKHFTFKPEVLGSNLKNILTSLHHLTAFDGEDALAYFHYLHEYTQHGLRDKYDLYNYCVTRFHWFEDNIKTSLKKMQTDYNHRYIRDHIPIAVYIKHRISL